MTATISMTLLVQLDRSEAGSELPRPARSGGPPGGVGSMGSNHGGETVIVGERAFGVKRKCERVFATNA
jgi:hypothetical protein